MLGYVLADCFEPAHPVGVEVVGQSIALAENAVVCSWVIEEGSAAPTLERDEGVVESFDMRLSDAELLRAGGRNGKGHRG